MALEQGSLAPDDTAGLVRASKTVLEQMYRTGDADSDWEGVLGCSPSAAAELAAAGLPQASCCLFTAAALRAMCAVRDVTWPGIVSLFAASVLEEYDGDSFGAAGSQEAAAKLSRWLDQNTKRYARLLVDEAGALVDTDDFAGTVSSLYRSGERELHKRQRQIDADLVQQILLTQIYTPDWLVRYLVDETLEPVLTQAYAGKKASSLPSGGPRLLDPACGSGRFLLYGLDVLTGKAVEGAVTAAAEHALHHQVYGMEIDPLARAICRAQLMLKLVGQYEVKYTQEAVKKVCENIHRPGQVRPGEALALRQLGSLVDARVLADYPDAFQTDKVSLELQTFDAVVMNPPYLDKREYCPGFSQVLSQYYFPGRGNLYGAFLTRMTTFCRPGGRWGVVAPQGWLFLKSFRQLREEIFAGSGIETMVHFGTGVFSATIDTAALVGARSRRKTAEWRAVCVDLRSFSDKQTALEDFANGKSNRVHNLSSDEIAFLPDRAFLYEMPQPMRRWFQSLPQLKHRADVALGMKTSDNKRFVRYWWQVRSQHDEGCADFSNGTPPRWVRYEKQTSGFPFYRAARFVVDWSLPAREYYQTHYSAQLPNRRFWFREGITFGMLSSRGFSAKYLPPGHMADMAANIVLPKDSQDLWFLLGLLNSHLAGYLLATLNPSVNFQVRDVSRLPVPVPKDEEHRLLSLITRLLVAVERIRDQWDETSPEFSGPVLAQINGGNLAERVSRFAQMIQSLSRSVQWAVEILDSTVYRIYGMDGTAPQFIVTSRSAGVSPVQENWDQPSIWWVKQAAYGLVCFALVRILGKEPETATGQSPASMAGSEEVAVWLDDKFGANSTAQLEKILGAELSQYLQKEFYPAHLRRWGKNPRLHLRRVNGQVRFGLCQYPGNDGSK